MRVILFGLIFILPFLDGGTSFLAESLILVLPLPLVLLALAGGKFRSEWLPGGLLWPWLAFLAFVALSVVGSASQIFSLPSFFLLLGIFLLFGLFLFTAEPENLKQVVWLILAVSFLLSLLSFYYLWPGVEKPAEMNLVYATHGHSHLADYLLLSIPLALALFWQTKRKRLKLALAALLVFYLVSFILTFSRGAFLALPAVVLLLVFLFPFQRVAEKLLAWLFILLPHGLLLLILLFSLSAWGIQLKLAQPRHWLIKQLIKPEFQTKRLNYWQQAWEGFRTRPFFGFGWGTFELVGQRFQRTTSSWSTFAHNFYLQVLAEAGPFALLAFLVFLFFSLFSLWSLVKKNKDPLLLGGFGAILASSLHSFLDYDWHFPAVFLTFLFLLANLMAHLPAPNSRFSRLSRGVNSRKPLRFAKGKGLLVGLAVLVFVFGQIQLLGEYFYQREDYQKALLFSPWPAVRVRRVGNEIFADDFAQGEKAAQRILALSSGDPSMHSWLGEKYNQAGQPEKAAEYYQKAIEYNPLGNYRLYPKLGKVFEKLKEEKKKDNLYDFLAAKLERREIFEEENAALAKTLYFIGQDYLEQRREKEVVFWWEKAVKLAPQWSYFHLELASLYAQLGREQKAGEVLRGCLQFYHPRAHCQEFLGESARKLEPAGYWREKILAIPED